MNKTHFIGVLLLAVAYVIGARYPAIARKIGLA